MAVGDKQKLITNILQEVLNQKAEFSPDFNWFINKHTKENFKENFHIIDEIFKNLNGSISGYETKRITKLQPDAYFGGNYNFIFEFDEFQHFSSFRKKTFELYPQNLKLNFDKNQWIKACETYSYQADKYRNSKKTKDFDFTGGRTAQRAYLDCFRDLLPVQHNLNPTLRLNEFEVIGIERLDKNSCKKIEQLITEKLK
ncbi:DUF7255 family protein [Faecalibacter macacae]|uniref:Uncharacterized protein n=1 Tax=Faecalibacter macacae TaxID=1859289 RepID=A0A3L9M4P3_9FLAO|nr:hypothetical protein [Faecalibacter macacae]RLZ06374.1 hypothetical protein EAH69_13760 [Faecalibacter macacae]